MATNYWRGTISNDWNGNVLNWSLAHVPTSAEPVAFDASSPNPSTLNVDSTACTCAGIDFTGAPGAVTWSGASNITISGGLTLKSGMTASFAAGLTINASGTITSNTVAFAGTLIIDGAGITVQLADDFTYTGPIMVLTKGAFVDNGYAVNGVKFASSNTNSRTLTKTGTWTLNGSTTVWDCPTSTNFNLSDTAGSLIFTKAGNITFAGGSLSYYKVRFAPVSGSRIMTISGSNTIGELSNTNVASQKNTIKFTDGTDQNITTLSVDGVNTTYRTILTGTSTGGWKISKTSGTVGLNNVSIAYSTAEGGATFNAYTANGCADGGSNTGWNFAAATTTFIKDIMRHHFIPAFIGGN